MVFGPLKKIGEVTGFLPSDSKSRLTKILEEMGYEKTSYFCRNDLGNYSCEFVRYRGKKDAVLGNVVISGNSVTLSSKSTPYSTKPQSLSDLCSAKKYGIECSDLKTLEKLPKKRRRFHCTTNEDLIKYFREINQQPSSPSSEG